MFSVLKIHCPWIEFGLAHLALKQNISWCQRVTNIYIALAHHLRSIMNPFLVMFHGVAKEFVVDEKVSIPTTMTGGLKSFETLRYLPNYSAAMQIYLSLSRWTMGYLPIQFYKVNFQSLYFL